MKKTEITWIEILCNFIEKYHVILFLCILAVGMYLRFYRLESTGDFGWDQARDAWVARDIVQGKHYLIGPRTGVGHFHIGPVYYYLLAPFYFLTNLDPVGSIYLNVILNLINFALIYFVAKKIFGSTAALFAITVYSFSKYLIEINQTAWNVTLMPGIAAFIFYGVTRVYEKDYKWIYINSLLAGFYFNLHFTAIFMPIVIFLSYIFVQEKRKVILYSIFSLPLIITWYLPNIIYEVQYKGGDGIRLQNFWKDYFIGLHGRFLLYRLGHDALIQFQTLVYFKPLSTVLKYILPLTFFILIAFEKDTKQKLFGYFISLWFIIPLLGFTIYGGSTSEYYFLFSVPMILLILIYLQKRLFYLKPKAIILAVLLFIWGYYAYGNTKGLWIKPTDQGLVKQKKETVETIKKGEKILFNEGDIHSYLYVIWVDDKIKPSL